jgi:L,D-peptidoglycan transpeptidase YkuD (ErfK/YbiS/YcfS/YnhG family)
MSTRPIASLFVYQSPLAKTRGVLRIGMSIIPCALGKGGVKSAKREGDGATPRGTLRALRLYRRPDRPMVNTRIPVRATSRTMGWCDDTHSSHYNQPVALPFDKSHEKLWRDDHLYDLVIDTDYNRRPAIKGRGSAIFIHLARPHYTPTEGCIAFNCRDLARLISMIDRNTRIHVR